MVGGEPSCFGIVGVVLLGLGLVASSGVYPGALVVLGVVVRLLARRDTSSRPAAVIGATALLLLVDQLVAWSFDAATGALERGPAIGAGQRWIVVIVAVGAGVRRSCSRREGCRCPAASLPKRSASPRHSV